MSAPTIEGYRFGRIVVDGEVFREDLILYPDRVASGWWRERGHSLSLRDVADILEFGPRIIIVGRGAFGRMDIPLETLREFSARGIEVRAMNTGEAVDTYNELKDQGGVVAALHLSC